MIEALLPVKVVVLFFLQKTYIFPALLKSY
nr:MAG TPA: protein of unknown function (DUF4492) [Caudoviricetes sp.]